MVQNTILHRTISRKGRPNLLTEKWDSLGQRKPACLRGELSEISVSY